jgi:cobalt-zinc-cadmium efflux system outer membrane protein
MKRTMHPGRYLIPGDALDYETTSQAVRRFEGDILRRAGRQRDDYYRLFTEGERSISDYFNAERDYNDIVRQYYDSLIRHRRSMIRLNTAVGQHILP